MFSLGNLSWILSLWLTKNFRGDLTLDRKPNRAIRRRPCCSRLYSHCSESAKVQRARVDILLWSKFGEDFYAKEECPCGRVYRRLHHCGEPVGFTQIRGGCCDRHSGKNWSTWSFEVRRLPITTRSYFIPVSCLDTGILFPSIKTTLTWQSGFGPNQNLPITETLKPRKRTAMIFHESSTNPDQFYHAYEIT